MTDWPTIASLATAGGTLARAVATFSSVRAGQRSTRIAERSTGIAEQKVGHFPADDAAAPVVNAVKVWGARSDGRFSQSGRGWVPERVTSSLGNCCGDLVSWSSIRASSR